MSRLEVFPPRLEIEERCGLYILRDDGPLDVDVSVRRICLGASPTEKVWAGPGGTVRGQYPCLRSHPGGIESALSLSTGWQTRIGIARLVLDR